MTDYTDKAFALTASEWMIQSHRDRAARIEAALREAHEAGRREQAQWRPIEAAPRDGTPVLLCFDYHPVSIGRYEYGTWVYAFCMTEGGDTPTCWMPLPQPPAEAETGHE